MHNAAVCLHSALLASSFLVIESPINWAITHSFPSIVLLQLEHLKPAQAILPSQRTSDKQDSRDFAKPDYALHWPHLAQANLPLSLNRVLIGRPIFGLSS